MRGIDAGRKGKDMTHVEVIGTIAGAVRETAGIRALFLSGSHGNGRADAYSDIDFLLVAEGGASDAVAALWREAVGRTGEIVLWWDRTVVPVLINAITADWTRTDVMMLRPDQMGAQVRSALKPVFDHDGIYEGLAEAAPQRGPNPARFVHEVENFIRVLGLMPLAVGRGEYINGALGVNLLRGALVELMIEETGAPDRGGILHLNRLIDAEQKAVLMAMPPALPERDAMISAQLAYAAAYLPRARRRAAALGVGWPERFEAVTWQRLGETLGVARPYAP